MADRPVVYDQRLDSLRTLSRWLDSRIRIPGTPIRFGLDAIMDIVPVLGDVAGVGFSSFIVLQAARMGASKSTLFRMLWNIGVDALAGAIPGLGVLFDVAWKANDWNMRLLERHAWEERAPSHGDWLFVIAIALAMLAVIAIPLVTLWFLLRWLAGGPA